MTDNGKEPSFAAMFEAGFSATKRYEPGQKIKAVVASIGKEWVFLDLGGKSEGYLSRKELSDEAGNLSVAIGDAIEAYFLSAEKNGMLFTMSLAGGPAAATHLEEAFHNHIPVEGFVVKEVQGGFEVTVGGNIRSFCPYSQMDVRRIEKAEDFIGKHFTFLIQEYSGNGRNIVLSRRKYLEEERKAQKEKLRETLNKGDIVKGTITSVRDFGAFVDIGGIEGLIPVSEIGWGRTEDVHAVLEVGMEVEVSVLKLDWDNDRFSFSLKETMPDPWDQVPARFPEGSVHTGTIARLVNFGAFVTLAPGIDGLLHISHLGGGRRINHPREVVKEGETVEVRIDRIDMDEKRLSLTLAAVAEAEKKEEQDRKEYKEYIETAKKSSGAGMGTLGDLLKKKMNK